MDYDAIINSVKKTNRLVVLEEAWPFASVASELPIWFKKELSIIWHAPIQRITTADISSALFSYFIERMVAKCRGCC